MFGGKFAMARRGGQNRAPVKGKPPRRNGAAHCGQAESALSADQVFGASGAAGAMGLAIGFFAMCFLGCFIDFAFIGLAIVSVEAPAAGAAGAVVSVWARAARGERTSAALRPKAVIFLNIGLFSKASRSTRRCLHETGCAFPDELRMNAKPVRREGRARV